MDDACRPSIRQLEDWPSLELTPHQAVAERLLFSRVFPQSGRIGEHIQGRRAARGAAPDIGSSCEVFGPCQDRPCDESSLMPQCHHRIDLRRPPRRDVARRKCHQHQ